MGADSPVAIIRTQEGAVVRLTLNRPERKNALDQASWALLRDLLEELKFDETARVVVLAGAGGTFCAGSDLAGASATEHPVSKMQKLGAVAEAVTSFPKPLIALVDGAAVGAGCNLALSCDFVVATPTARFSQIFVRRGLSIDFGGSWTLPRLVGLQQAKRLVMLAEMIGAYEAEHLGLVTWVRSADEVDDFVRDLAQRLAALPPVALAQSKSLLHQAMNQTFREALENETRAQAVNLATEDAPIAYRAFLDKDDAPTYTGRWAVR